MQKSRSFLLRIRAIKGFSLVVAFSMFARIVGERATIHSPPALFVVVVVVVVNGD